MTAFVWTENVADEAPAGIVTFFGAVALAEFDDRAMVRPPLGAAPLSVTVPRAEEPPPTGLGLIENPIKDAGWIVRVTVSVVPFRLADIVT